MISDHIIKYNTLKITLNIQFRAFKQPKITDCKRFACKFNDTSRLKIISEQDNRKSLESRIYKFINEANPTDVREPQIVTE